MAMSLDFVCDRSSMAMSLDFVCDRFINGNVFRFCVL